MTKTAQEWAAHILGSDAEPDQVQALGRDIQQAMDQARNEGLEEASKECLNLITDWNDKVGSAATGASECVDLIRALKKV